MNDLRLGVLLAALGLGLLVSAWLLVVLGVALAAFAVIQGLRPRSRVDRLSERVQRVEREAKLHLKGEVCSGSLGRHS